MNRMIFLFSVLFLAGCSLDASIMGPQNLPSVLAQKAASKEIVPLSQQGLLTSAGYRVQSSVSYYNGKTESVTEKGYRVRSTVQAALYRE